MNDMLSILDGANTSLGDGGILAIFSVILVFLILALIIAITYGISLIIKKYSKNTPTPEAVTPNTQNEVNITDDDMMTAVLVASIDYRNETKKDIKVVNVKEIK